MRAREERQRSPRQDEAKAGTQRRGLRAAMEVFAREGYHAARIDAIAEVAGVSELPALADTAPAPSALLLRSVGVVDAGVATDR